MDKPLAGFREIEHTADWELEVWAPDLPTLLEQAARGMYALSGMVIDSDSLPIVSFNLKVGDPESILVNFLQELLWLGENMGLGVDKFSISMDDKMVVALLEGGKIVAQAKEIKAVTYHNLEVLRTDSGLQARVIFDV